MVDSHFCELCLQEIFMVTSSLLPLPRSSVWHEFLWRATLNDRKINGQIYTEVYGS